MLNINCSLLISHENYIITSCIFFKNKVLFILLGIKHHLVHIEEDHLVINLQELPAATCPTSPWCWKSGEKLL